MSALTEVFPDVLQQRCWVHKTGNILDKLPKSLKPQATECLEKDKDKLFVFYDFPAIHWTHIRTTNPIESTFATIN